MLWFLLQENILKPRKNDHIFHIIDQIKVSMVYRCHYICQTFSGIKIFLVLSVWPVNLLPCRTVTEPSPLVPTQARSPLNSLTRSLLTGWESFFIRHISTLYFQSYFLQLIKVLGNP